MTLPPITLSVTHETRYDYGALVEQAHHIAFLRPTDDAMQRLLTFDMQVQPAPSHHSTGRDVYGNSRACFSIAKPHHELLVQATSRVRVQARHAGLVPAQTLAWDALVPRLRYQKGQPYNAASEFVDPSPLLPSLATLRHYARASFPPGRPVAEAAIALMSRIHADFAYAPASTDVSTPVIDAFERRKGVCQDFAHILIACLRSLGLAARYVSGYLLTTPLPGQPRLQGADASHAWVAVYCPSGVQGAGSGGPHDWIELDPTNNCLADTSHVRLATGRDFGDVAPLRGVIRGGGKHTLVVRVSTEPVHN